MDNRRLLEEYLLEGGPEERKRKLEIAWDVYKFLPDVWEKVKREFYKKNIEPSIGKILGEGFYTHTITFRDRVWQFNFAITKIEWTVFKEPVYVLKVNRYNNGNYQVWIENWKDWGKSKSKFPQHLKEKQAQLVNHVLKYKRDVSKGWGNGLFYKTYVGENLPDIQFIIYLMSSQSVEEAELILEMIKDFKMILDLRNEKGKTVEEKLTEIVQLLQQSM